MNRDPSTVNQTPTEVVQWRSREIPEALDALVMPEDTYLLTQAMTEELDPDATPFDLWVALERAARTEKHPVGSVMIAEGRSRGVKYIATVIVYDFEAERICRRDIVRVGLRDALSELGKRGCDRVGIFPLGTMRGGISSEEYLDVIAEVATRPGVEFPRTVYLLGRDSEPGEGAAR